MFWHSYCFGWLPRPRPIQVPFNSLSIPALSFLGSLIRLPRASWKPRFKFDASSMSTLRYGMHGATIIPQLLTFLAVHASSVRHLNSQPPIRTSLSCTPSSACTRPTLILVEGTPPWGSFERSFMNVTLILITKV